MRGTDRLPAAAAARLRGLGSPGLVVLAALVIDLAAIVLRVGPTGVGSEKLLIAPGIVGMALCAWYGTRRAVRGALAGAAVLVLNAVLLHYTGVEPYSTLLPNASFTQLAAALELVAFCTRRARPPAAVTSVTALVIGGLATVLGTGQESDYEIYRSLIIGLALLLGAVLAGLANRNLTSPSVLAGYAKSFREHWAVVGSLAVLLFIELASALEGGVLAVPFSLISLAMLVITVRGIDQPARAALINAGLMMLGAVLRFFTGATEGLFIFGGVPTAQVGIGILLAVALVRRERARQATSLLFLLTIAVVLTVGLNARAGSRSHASYDLRIALLWIAAALIVLGVCIAVGLVLRARDTQQANAFATAVQDAQTNERMALARELHDVVAHHVTGIVVQAQAAKIVGDTDPRVLVEALDRIESAGAEALVAMRRLVASMRGGAPVGSSGASEAATTDLRADLTALIDADTIGVPTESHVDLPAEVPQELARSVLRLVQESLTNVSKHAHGARLATVEATLSGGELYVSVRDDGKIEQRPEVPGGRAGSGGYGLVGMRERVGLLDGRFSAGRDETGGWRVQAWLPWQEPNGEGTS